MNWTTRFRIVYAALFVAVVVAALVGWFMNRDVAALDGVLMWSAAAVGIGEGSNVGKRATWSKDAAIQQSVERAAGDV